MLSAGAVETVVSHRPESSGEIKYRPDIDGLRAVAVLLVVVFHMGLRLPAGLLNWVAAHAGPKVASRLAVWLPGGFVGVDIFFVISGFLIGGILLREQEHGTFSIARFYERRVRRIFPALMGVLLFTLAAGYAALLPYEFRELGISTVAAIFSASNVFFYKHSGYFEPNALLKPLLHTWSLAVEEQFYVVFPLVLMLLRGRTRRTVQIVIGLMAIVSFVFSMYQVHARPEAAFYLPWSRAWELLTGVLVASGVLPPLRSQRARDATSLGGILLLAVAAMLLTATSPFPGAAALLPCCGSALLIYAGSNGASLVGRALSLRPVVFLGLISYSLYLWHWPLLLANKYEYFRFLHLSSWWLFVLMLGVSTLSWRFVEQPFRAGRFRPQRAPLLAGAAIAALVVSAMGLAAYRSNGAPNRFPPALLSLARYPERGSSDPQWGNGCFVYAGYSTLKPHCLAMQPGRTNILLLGDSHAAHLHAALAAALPEANILEVTAANCKPLLASEQDKDPLCRELTERIFGQYLPEHHPDAVLLSAFWNANDLAALHATLSQLHAEKQRVYVIGPSPAYDQPLPILLIKQKFRSDAGMPMRHMEPSAAEYRALDEALASDALSSGAERYISLRDVLCPGGECVEYVDADTPLEFDASHLTAAGSQWTGMKLKEAHLLP